MPRCRRCSTQHDGRAVAPSTPDRLVIVGTVETEEDRTRHEANNLELHKLLVVSSGNRRLSEMYGVKAHLQIARIHNAEIAHQLSARLQQEQSEHEAILAALEARDAEKLVAALQTHIDRAKTSLIRSIQESSNA